MAPGIFLISQLLSLLLSASGPTNESAIDKAEEIFSPESIYQQLNFPDLSREAFSQAYEGYISLKDNELLLRDTILTIIDYSLPSTKKRLYILDIKNIRVLESSFVAHGKGSGVNYAEKFSNIPRSCQSSLGFFITANTYQGKHGYSLRIKGVESGINHNAWKRAIVIHGADYVSEDFIKEYGRLGRSLGCPALPHDRNRDIINLIKDESCLYIYAGDPSYPQLSGIINSTYYSQTVPE